MLNVALNKPATQSSTSIWSKHSDPRIEAQIANSGDIESDKFFHTNQELDPWWQVDLQDSFLVRKIVLFNRAGCQERLRYFTILRSNNGEDWTPFFKKADDSVFGKNTNDPFVIDINADCLARFVRVRLDGVEFLHFKECQIFGEQPEPEVYARLLGEDSWSKQQRFLTPPGRDGKIAQVGRFLVFNDEKNYSELIVKTINNGSYENRERSLVSGFVLPTDRVIEVGTAIGTLAMTAASVVGPRNVLTFDANPHIMADARDNFRRNDLSDIDSKVGILKCRPQMGLPGETVDFYIDAAFWASRLDATPTTPGIVDTVQIPVFCLEDEIQRHAATVLVCDIEGGEIALLSDSDLAGIRLIIMETHYAWMGEVPTDTMVRKLLAQGFNFHLGSSGGHVIVLRREGTY